jgi:hypothetical protein
MNFRDLLLRLDSMEKKVYTSYDIANSLSKST